MTGERRKILIGMLSASAFSILWVYVGLTMWTGDVPASVTAPERVGYAVRCEVFVGLMLLLGIATVARQRFFSDSDIDGAAARPGTSVDINIRYVVNTSEQVLLAFIAHLALAAIMPAESLHIIPILVALFVFARLCFWIGYHVSPAARAFGFACTFYPTIGVYVFVLWKIAFGT